MAAGGQFISALRREWATRFGETPPFTCRIVAGDRDDFVPATSSLAPFPRAWCDVVPGNHVEIVKPTSAAERSVRVVCDMLCGDAPVRGRWHSALVAAELQDHRTAVRQLEPHAAELDEAALVQLALSLEAVGRGHDALKLLEGRGASGFRLGDPLGVLAGRLKRRWLAERRAGDLEAALHYYGLGLAAATLADREINVAQAMYHAINIAFLELMRVPGVEQEVPEPAHHYAAAALRYSEAAPVSSWSMATMAEARLILGELDEACARYERALALASVRRDAESMYSNAIRVAERRFGPEGAARVREVFGVREA